MKKTYQNLYLCNKVDVINLVQIGAKAKLPLKFENIHTTHFD